MCKCTPGVRTPFCGKPGCEWPTSIPAENVRLAPESGFFDLKEAEYCSHPSHEPPGLLTIPSGKGYRHVCPGCGRTVILHGDQVRC